MSEIDTQKPVATNIRASLLREGALLRGDLDLIADWDREKDVIWIDILSNDKNDIEPLLEEWFGFHELAAEDSTSENTLPKYDAFKNYDFFVFRSIHFSLADHGVDTVKTAAFIGQNMLMTIHGQPLDAIENVWNRLPNDRRMLQRGADFVLYSILDNMVDGYFPIMEEIEEKIDAIHDAVFSAPSPSLLDELLHLKRDLNVIRRQSLPQRELFNVISRGDAPFIQREQLIYFRDLYDHMYRISESIDVERDLATTTMEAYLSVIANRTNDIMKVLTIFSSILLPVNFVAGIYGMNFEHMPELKWHYGYLWAYGLMAAIAFVMLFWFWSNGWIRLKSRRLASAERRVRRALRIEKRPAQRARR